MHNTGCVLCLSTRRHVMQLLFLLLAFRLSTIKKQLMAQRCLGRAGHHSVSAVLMSFPFAASKGANGQSGGVPLSPPCVTETVLLTCLWSGKNYPLKAVFSQTLTQDSWWGGSLCPCGSMHPGCQLSACLFVSPLFDFLIRRGARRTEGQKASTRAVPSGAGRFQRECPSAGPVHR